MSEEAIPILRVTNAGEAVSWYTRLGYETEWEHRFEPSFPAFVSVARDGGARLFLSEHLGDARPDTLVSISALLMSTSWRRSSVRRSRSSRGVARCI